MPDPLLSLKTRADRRSLSRPLLQYRHPRSLQLAPAGLGQSLIPDSAEVASSTLIRILWLLLLVTLNLHCVETMKDTGIYIPSAPRTGFYPLSSAVGQTCCIVICRSSPCCAYRSVALSLLRWTRGTPVLEVIYHAGIPWISFYIQQ